MRKNRVLTAIQIVIAVMLIVLVGVKYKEYGEIQEVKQEAIQGTLLGEEYIESYQGDYKDQLAQEGVKDPFKETNYGGVGEAGVVGVIRIPKIKVQEPIYMGTSDDVLKKGVGLIGGTDIPRNEKGLSSQIAGHRGYMGVGYLFQKVNQLEKGDSIEIETTEGVLQYEVVRKLVVKPDETDKHLQDEEESYVTLVTCTPMYNWKDRLLVEGKLIGVK